METNHIRILSRILNQYAPVDLPTAETLWQQGTLEILKKNEVIFHEKRFNAFEYFQLEGVSHRYNLDKDQHPVTSGIYQNDIVITPHFTRTSNGHSIFTLQTLTDCTYLKEFGFLFGPHEADQRVILREMKVKKSKKLRNTHFKISSGNYLRAQRFATEESLILLGVYHSHPDHQMIPSAKDCAAALPNISYVIISIWDKKYGGIRSWRLDQNRTQFEEEKVDIIN